MFHGHFSLFTSKLQSAICNLQYGVFGCRFGTERHQGLITSDPGLVTGDSGLGLGYKKRQQNFLNGSYLETWYQHPPYSHPPIMPSEAFHSLMYIYMVG